MERWKVKPAASYRGAMSNARGRQFEAVIDAGCRYYRMHGIANIEKTPEPFRCLHKGAGGIAKVQFMSHAQPDYKGVLKGGRAIVFEAKATDKDRIMQSVLTEKQAGNSSCSGSWARIPLCAAGYRDGSSWCRTPSGATSSCSLGASTRRRMICGRGVSALMEL